MEAEQIVVAAPALVEAILNRALGKHAAKRKVALQTPHYAVVPTILAETDLIAVVPAHVMCSYADITRFKSLALPFEAPAVKVTQFWHQRSHHDRGHSWLRSVIAELFMEKTKKRAS